MVGKSTGTESDLQGIEREHSGWSVEGRTKKKKRKEKKTVRYESSPGHLGLFCIAVIVWLPGLVPRNSLLTLDKSNLQRAG